MNERMGMYEIFAEKKLSCEEIVSAMINSTKIPANKIGSEYDFYSPSTENNQLSLGIKVEYYKEGYLSFIKLASMPEISTADYYLMCSKLAFNLKTNIAIYNPTEDAENIFIFYSNGFYQEATENLDVQDGFLVHTYGDKKTVDSLIQIRVEM